MENIEKQIQDLTSEVSKSLNTLNEQAKMNGAAYEETKAAHEKLVSRLESLENIKTVAEKQQAHLDELTMKLQNFTPSNTKMTPKDAIMKAIVDNAEALKQLKSGARKGVNFDIKADLTSSAYTGDVVQPDFDNVIYRSPVQNTLRVRTLLPVAATTSDSFRFNQRSSYTDAHAYTAEGNAFPQSEFGITRVTRNIEKFGARLDFTKEMLEDTQFLQSFVVSELIDRAVVKEDQQLLYGTGSSQIYGVSAEAAAYADNGLADTNVTEVDVLINAISYLESQYKYLANGILIAPREFYKILLNKDSNGQYNFPMLTMDGGVLRLAGVPIFKSTAVTAGDFFVGDWRKYGRIVDRAGLSVEFSDQNGTNFEEDQITAKVSQRLLLAATEPNAIIFGQMGSALALGSA